MYFIINFTIDLLALYFASRLLKIPTTVKRLILGSLLGAALAIITVLFIQSKITSLILSALYLLLISLICPKEVSLSRRVKFGVGFFVISTFIGGAVYHAFILLDQAFDSTLLEDMGGAENKNILILSLIVLLMIGILKIVKALFSHTFTEKNAKIEITLMGKTTVVEGLIDSGNLLVDPVDSTPVMLIKKEKIKKVFPLLAADLTQISLVNNVRAFKMRLIPVRIDGKSRVLVGAKPERAYFINKGKKERIELTIAIDSQEGSYGGYFALIPLATVENVI